MIFAKLDVDFYDHPKFSAAGFAATGLWACGLAYCRKHETDGLIPFGVPLLCLDGATDLATILCSVGLWKRNAEGFVVTNYAAKNEVKADISERRESTRLRVAKHRAQKAGDAVGNAVGNENVTGVTPRVQNASVPGSGSGSVGNDESAKAFPARVAGPVPTRVLPRHIVAVEQDFWIAEYERAVTEEKGGGPWSFPRKAISALVSVIQAHCSGDDRKRIADWVGEDVRDFVRALRAIDADPARWSSYGPDGLQRWHNEDRPGHEEHEHAVDVSPTEDEDASRPTREEARASAAAALQALTGKGGA